MNLLTTVPLLATLEPAERTRASTTLPKLPSPMSFKTSKRSSSDAVPVVGVGVEDLRCIKSWATVMIVD